MASPSLQLGDKRSRNLSMTAPPVLHIKRRFGIYVINSLKTIRRTRGAPGCLCVCSQLNTKPLEAKVHPDPNAPVSQATLIKVS